MTRFHDPDNFAVDHRLSFNINDRGDEIVIWGDEKGLRYLADEIERVLRARGHRHLFSEMNAGWDLTPQSFGAGDRPLHAVCINYHENWDD